MTDTSFVEFRLSRPKILVPYLVIVALALITQLERALEGAVVSVVTLLVVTLVLILLGLGGASRLVRLRFDAEGLELSAPFFKSRRLWDEVYDFDLRSGWVAYQRRNARSGLIPNIFDARLEEIWSEIQKRRQAFVVPPPG